MTATHNLAELNIGRLLASAGDIASTRLTTSRSSAAAGFVLALCAAGCASQHGDWGGKPSSREVSVDDHNYIVTYLPNETELIYTDDIPGQYVTALDIRVVAIAVETTEGVPSETDPSQAIAAANKFCSSFRSSVCSAIQQGEATSVFVRQSFVRDGQLRDGWLLQHAVGGM